MASLTKSTWLKVVGVVGIVGGAIALYLSGVSANAVSAIVAAVFALAGVIAVLFGSGIKASDVVKSATDAATDIEAATKK
jgi:uncharacterized membrane protein HdeD (DUF308 family)